MKTASDSFSSKGLSLFAFTSSFCTGIEVHVTFNKTIWTYLKNTEQQRKGFLQYFISNAVLMTVLILWSLSLRRICCLGKCSNVKFDSAWSLAFFSLLLHNRYKWPRIVQSCGGEFKGPETSEFVDGYASILQSFLQYLMWCYFTLNI